MSPKPDCGEESYEGHGRLQDYKMLVTGGDSVLDVQQQLLMLKKALM